MHQKSDVESFISRLKHKIEVMSPAERIEYYRNDLLMNRCYRISSGSSGGCEPEERFRIYSVNDHRERMTEFSEILIAEVERRF